MKLDSNVVEFNHQSLARARKVRFMCEVIREQARDADLSPLEYTKQLTLDGRLMVESHAHLRMKTKHPRAASETTWAQVLDELEAMVDEGADDVDEAEGES